MAGTVTAYAVFEQLSFVSYLPGDHGNWTATTTTGDTGAFFDDIRIGSSVPTFATGNDGLLVDVPGLGKQPAPMTTPTGCSTVGVEAMARFIPITSSRPRCSSPLAV